MFQKRSFLTHPQNTMLTPILNQAIAQSETSAVGKLALRTAIASLELLKAAASDLNCPIEELTGEKLIAWESSQSAG